MRTNTLCSKYCPSQYRLQTSTALTLQFVCHYDAIYEPGLGFWKYPAVKDYEHGMGGDSSPPFSTTVTHWLRCKSMHTSALTLQLDFHFDAIPAAGCLGASQWTLLHWRCSWISTMMPNQRLYLDFEKYHSVKDCKHGMAGADGIASSFLPTAISHWLRCKSIHTTALIVQLDFYEDAIHEAGHGLWKISFCQGL